MEVDGSGNDQAHRGDDEAIGYYVPGPPVYFDFLNFFHENLNLKKVNTVEECHFIVAFCQCLSQSKRNTENALQNLPSDADKPVLQVMLYQTSDLDYSWVPDSCGTVVRNHIFTVGFLISEDKKLLQSWRNDVSLARIKVWIDKIKVKKPEIKCQSSCPITETLRPLCKYLTIKTGETLNCYSEIKTVLHKRRPELQEVTELDKCDVIFVFSPDTIAALNVLPALKPVVLFELQQLSENNKTFHGSKRYVFRENIFRVDCLLSDNTGLEKCEQNDEELLRVADWLIPERSRQQKSTVGGERGSYDMVLHPTSNPSSSRSVSNNNMLTVDCLCSNDKKLQKCHQNTEALLKVANWLMPEESEDGPNQGKRPMLRETKPVKIFSYVSGKTLGSHDNFIRTLKQRTNVQEVFRVEECDVILFFSPIVSRAGTDMEAALKKFDDTFGVTKPAVMVVLHHTIDPNRIVADSSKSVSRENTLTVDCLFHEDKGLLQCTKNTETLSTVSKWIKTKADLKIRSGSQTNEMTQFSKTNKCNDQDYCINAKKYLNKYFTVSLGNIQRLNEDIKTALYKQRSQLQEVSTAEECDVILVFSTFVSQAQTDIKTTLKGLLCIPDLRPVVWIVFHNISDQKMKIPDRNRSVTAENIVDCLYNKERGILQCIRNYGAMCIKCQVENGLIPKESEDGPNQGKRPMLRETKPVKIFSYVSGKTLGSHDNFIRTLKQRTNVQEVFRVEECDVILFFSPIVSRAGTDMEAALKKFDDTFGVTKPAVMVVLHHTIDPNRIVADSSKSVSRENTLTVDCLFHEDKGLLQCTKNTETLSTVSKWIEKKVATKTSSADQLKNKFANSIHSTTAWLKNRMPGISSDINQALPQVKSHVGNLKFFTCVTGKTLDSHKDFVRTLCKKRAELQEVFTEAECDIILVFCPIVSVAETDIKAALRQLHYKTDSKPAVLVVLHCTFNPNMCVSDSKRLVKRENTLTVDCLFCEDRGVLQCDKNQEAFKRVSAWIEKQLNPAKYQINKGLQDDARDNYDRIRNSAERNKGSSSANHREDIVPEKGLKIQKIDPSSPQQTFIRKLRCHCIERGTALDPQRQFLRELNNEVPEFQEVCSVGECDVILVLCTDGLPLDLDGVLQNIPDNKPAALVVFHDFLHHENIEDTSSFVIRENTLTVDFRFLKGTDLLDFPGNIEALGTVVQWLKGKEVKENMMTWDAAARL